MNKFNTTLAAAVLGFSLCLSGVAFATIPGAIEAPSADADHGAPEGLYEQNHQGALGALTQLKGIVTAAEVSANLTKLSTALAQLPALQAAYVEAKKGGKDAEIKAALDAYVQSVHSIVDLALPLERLLQVDGQVMGGFEELGPDGAKLKAEKDIAALITEIDAALKPINDANEVVGPLQGAAAKATQARIKEMAPKIFGEELAAQVEKMLNGQGAK